MRRHHLQVKPQYFLRCLCWALAAITEAISQTCELNEVSVASDQGRIRAHMRHISCDSLANITNHEVEFNSLTPIHAILASTTGVFDRYKVPVVLARMAKDGVNLTC